MVHFCFAFLLFKLNFYLKFYNLILRSPFDLKTDNFNIVSSILRSPLVIFPTRRYLSCIPDYSFPVPPFMKSLPVSFLGDEVFELLCVSSINTLLFYLLCCPCLCVSSFRASPDFPFSRPIPAFYAKIPDFTPISRAT